MNYKDFQKIMNLSKDRNKEIEERKKQKEIMEELGIEQY